MTETAAGVAAIIGSVSYQSQTIAKTIKNLNQQYFLPAIQREFVWKPDQIIQLFDSIMRGYPISSFLFWELEQSSQPKWQAYKFLDTATTGGTRNEVANTQSVQALVLILDGQQRLTSLNIGLRGFYIEKKKYARYDDPDAYVRKRLFLNVAHDPVAEGSEASDGVYHQFAFLDPAHVKSQNKVWFDVSRVLSVDNEAAFDAMREDLIDALPDYATKEQMKIIRRNMDRLFRAIHRDNVISYYLEIEQDYDRVLDIFVRANAGGTKLSKSDLLMSTVTASWGDIDAREEIHGFVHRLNHQLTRRNSFDKDFVMKTCLVLSDLPVQYRVQNFNHENLTKIRRDWSNIKQAVERSVDLVNRYGIDADTLTSANALIPVLYFLFQRPELDLRGTTPYAVRNAGLVRRWLTSVLLTGAFGGSSDTALSSIRSVLRNTPHVDDFPAESINAALRSSGRSSRGEDVLDAVTQLSYGKKGTFLALSLVYEDKAWGTVPHHVDHILPRSSYSSYNDLAAAGRPNDYWLKDHLGNLCLLMDRENLEKSDLDFETWIASRDSSFLQRHLIPNDSALWRRERLADFVAAREALIEARLRDLLEITEESSKIMAPEEDQVANDFAALEPVGQ